jgi:hypothetical protein
MMKKNVPLNIAALHPPGMPREILVLGDTVKQVRNRFEATMRMIGESCRRTKLGLVLLFSNGIWGEKELGGKALLR